MSRNPEVNDLIRLSQKDLRAALILSQTDEHEMETIGFHLQQDAEKAW